MDRTEEETAARTVTAAKRPNLPPRLLPLLYLGLAHLALGAAFAAVAVHPDGFAAFQKRTVEFLKDGSFTGSAGREGTFTFTTDATLVMQNNEAGIAPGPATRVVWKITPTTKAVPTAVVRF